MNLEVDDDKKAEIANVITSPDSPVGIDAKNSTVRSTANAHGSENTRNGDTMPTRAA